jgi:hypothetical protein
MNFIFRIWRSTVGRKFIMALTGGDVRVRHCHLLAISRSFCGSKRQSLRSLSATNLGWSRSARIVLWDASCFTSWPPSLTARTGGARPARYEGDPTPIATSYAFTHHDDERADHRGIHPHHLLHFTLVTKHQFQRTGFCRLPR